MIVDMQLYFLLMLQYLIVAHNGQHIGLLDFSFSTFIPHILTNFSCFYQCSGQYPKYINFILIIWISVPLLNNWYCNIYPIAGEKYISVPGHCFWYVLSHLPTPENFL